MHKKKKNCVGFCVINCQIEFFFEVLFLLNDFFLSSAKALNGSNFVHVHIRYQRNTFQKLEDSIRRATHRIIQHTGLQMEGHDIYVRTNASDSKGRGKYKKWFLKS